MNKAIDISGVVLRTPRLFLRPWKREDLQDFYAYASVDGVGQMAGWLPHKDIEESRAILDMFIQGKKTFALEYQGKAIGSLGIEEYAPEDFPEFDEKQGREIGYALSKEYWGMGLMAEAVQAAVSYLFGEEKLDFLVCCHFLENHQSRRVQEKCGFVHYKRVKTQTRYGLVKDSWASLLLRDEPV